MKPKVGIVLVNFNGEKFQNECIRSIRNMNYTNYEIIVVDNGSKDNSIENLRKEFNDIIIIETGKNNGVARGNNIGIKEAIKLKCEYILLLNNDTEVHENMLDEMLNSADENTMVTCKMYYYEPKDILWYAGGEINWKRATTVHYGCKEKDNGQYDEEKYVEYSPTCSLLMHKSVFDKVGYMDEKYFMYYDDTDFLARCNKNNIKTLYQPRAKLWHKVSSSSGGDLSPILIYYCDRNRLYFIEKHFNKKFKVKTFFYISRFIKYFKWINKKELSKVSIKGLRDYRKGKMNYQDINN